MIKNKTRIAFDFSYEIDGERRKSYEKLAQIVCSSHWSSGIDIFGIINKDQSLFFNLVNKGVIAIDECEYELQGQRSDSEGTRSIKSMLGKRRDHPVLHDMAVLFRDEPFELSEHYRNTIYLPNLRALVRADGMKPEDAAEMLSLDGCEKIILFPYFPLDGKLAYYELSLAVVKDSKRLTLGRLDKSVP